MRFRPAARPCLLAGLLAFASPLIPDSGAQAIDPAVVGERLQRLQVTVDSVEAASVSQKRQIDTLANQIQRLREEQTRDMAELSAKSSQRPWAEDLRRQNEDLKRLAAAIEEVDRKRVADHEQVLKVLADLRKAVAALAEAPAAKPTRRGTREDKAPDRQDPPADPAVKAIPYTVGRGETLSVIVEGFNVDARKKGYQTLSVQQVMQFNHITDARRIPVGAILNLPLYPASGKP